MLNCRGITVLGLGNLLLKDDGIGVWLLRELLQQNDLPGGVYLREVGTAIFAVPSLIEDETSLLLVDALQGGGEPGTVYKFTEHEMGCGNTGSRHLFSLHDYRLQDLLFLPEIMKSYSPHIFGVEPAEMTFGYGLSPRICHMLPLLSKGLKNEIKRILSFGQV